MVVEGEEIFQIASRKLFSQTPLHFVGQGRKGGALLL
jgi:hypothetical protein